SDEARPIQEKGELDGIGKSSYEGRDACVFRNGLHNVRRQTHRSRFALIFKSPTTGHPNIDNELLSAMSRVGMSLVPCPMDLSNDQMALLNEFFDRLFNGFRQCPIRIRFVVKLSGI